MTASIDNPPGEADVCRPGCHEVTCDGGIVLGRQGSGSRLWVPRRAGRGLPCHLHLEGWGVSSELIYQFL